MYPLQYFFTLTNIRLWICYNLKITKKWKYFEIFICNYIFLITNSDWASILLHFDLNIQNRKRTCDSLRQPNLISNFCFNTCLLFSFIYGYLHRNKPYSSSNETYLKMRYSRFLIDLSRKLPKNLLDKAWPIYTSPTAVASENLRRMYRSHLKRLFRKSLTEEQIEMLRLKSLAFDLFYRKYKKESYCLSVKVPYKKDLVTGSSFYRNSRKGHRAKIDKKNFVTSEAEKETFRIAVDKYNRHGYKQQPRIIVLTNKTVYGYDFWSLRKRDEIKINEIHGKLFNLKLIVVVLFKTL